MTMYSTKPTTAVLARTLTPSHSAWPPKTRFMPVMTLNCSYFPVNFLKWMPPCSAAPPSTTTRTTTKNGVSTSAIETSPLPSASTATSVSGLAARVPIMNIWSVPAAAPRSIVVGSMRAAAPTPSQAVMSWDLES